MRQSLVQREWATVDAEGLRLTAPDALLDSWRDDYGRPDGERISVCTPLHGLALTEALKATSQDADGRLLLAAFTAAQWLAPYARSGRDFVYVDHAGFAALRRHLEIGPASRGSNLEVVQLKDEGPLRDAFEAAPGIVTTSRVQTYLDLWASGERGREAADHLRQKKLRWLS